MKVWLLASLPLVACQTHVGFKSQASTCTRNPLCPMRLAPLDVSRRAARTQPTLVPNGLPLSCSPLVLQYLAAPTWWAPMRCSTTAG